LGNVLATVSDKKIQYSVDETTVEYYNADVISAQDYYPFGMLMPGRKYSIANTNYRYGFNGKENDNDAGEGIQDYGLRIYDGRLGRFLSVDPLGHQFPWNSVYSYAEGDPVNYIDLDGGEKPPLKAQSVPVSKRPIIEPVYSEGPPLAVQQARQRALSISLILTPEQKKAADQAAIIKQLKSNQATLKQGGYLGSDQYKIVKDRYDMYGQYLPGPSDIVDGLTAIDELSKGNYKAAAAAGFFLIPGADVFKPLKSLKGVGGEVLEGYLKKFGNQADHLTKLDIQGALKDIAKTPVLKKNGVAWQHLKEVEEALSGVGNNLDKLTKDINAGKFTDDVLKQAETIRGTLQKQKDKITDVLNEAKKNAQ